MLVNFNFVFDKQDFIAVSTRYILMNTFDSGVEVIPCLFLLVINIFFIRFSLDCISDLIAVSTISLISSFDTDIDFLGISILIGFFFPVFPLALELGERVFERVKAALGFLKVFHRLVGALFNLAQNVSSAFDAEFGLDQLNFGFLPAGRGAAVQLPHLGEQAGGEFILLLRLRLLHQ